MFLSDEPIESLCQGLDGEVLGEILFAHGGAL